MTGAYDAIVVGGGHNGLTAAAYLGKAGKRTLVLERREVVGGAAVTEEFHPGYRNSMASYVVSLLRPEVVRDLDLKRHGYETIRLEGTFGPLIDGRYTLLTGEEANDRREIGKFSNRDYDSMQRFNAMLQAVGGVVREQMLRPPPRLHGGGVADLMDALRLGNAARKLDPELRHRMLQLFTTGIGDILDRWFDSEVVKIKYAASATASGFNSLYTPGSAINLLHLSVGEIDGERGAWAFVRGGMGAITQAMASAAREAGVAIRTGAPVERILVEQGRAVGVRLDGGEEIRARVVLANTDPKRTFLKLVGTEHLDEGFAADIAAWRQESATVRMNLALNGVPDFTALPSDGIGVQHQSFIRLIPSLADMEAAYVSAKRGEIPKVPIVSAVIPSSLDDSLAPPGCHVMGLLCQHFPFQLSQGRSWDDHRDEVADLVIDHVARYAPNIRNILVNRQIYTPLDLERVFGLTGGDVYHGRMDLDQIFSLRPHPKAARYATPIAGLYLCGSGAHPGGGVSGAPGHNCAKRVLKDIR
jgi:phytoene dehydrogenase-like protein